MLLPLAAAAIVSVRWALLRRPRARANSSAAQMENVNRSGTGHTQHGAGSHTLDGVLAPARSRDGTSEGAAGCRTTVAEV